MKKFFLIMLSLFFIFKIYSDNMENDSFLLIETGLSVPLVGCIYLEMGYPVTNQLLLSHYAAFFNREWMIFLEHKEWITKSGFLGTCLKYYPLTKDHTNLYIGGDIGIVGSYQTYNPLNMSDFVFFLYVELYLIGCTIPITSFFLIDFVIGGGYAPVSAVVNIQDHTHPAKDDFYPLIDFRIQFRL